MGERVLGMDEAGGSSPPTSTRLGLKYSKGSLAGLFFVIMGR